jgi:DNA transformation protein
MVHSDFYRFVAGISSFYTRSMFGGTGLFHQDAMFILIMNARYYLRGGNTLDKQLRELGCKRFCHVKKQTAVTVNYYDITDLYLQHNTDLKALITQSISVSIGHRKHQKSPSNIRLRDLPNMRLTLERMVIKSGISDVSCFMELGAVEVYRMVRQKYGKSADINLLWKFAGAIDGVHWKLLHENTKNALRRSWLQ